MRPTSVSATAVDRTVPEASLMATATAAAGLLAAVRWTQAKGVDFGAPMVASQAGAFPPGLVTNLFRGFDVCLLTTAPMLLGFSPFWSLRSTIAAMILLNSMDAEILRARQAEQQKQLEAQRKQRDEAAAAAKQRVSVRGKPAGWAGERSSQRTVGRERTEPFVKAITNWASGVGAHWSRPQPQLRCAP